MARPAALRGFFGNLFYPAQFGADLIEAQAQHPHSFVKSMPDLFSNCGQDFGFSCAFLLQKFSPPRELLSENARPALPGETEPGEKRGTVALLGPIFALERVGESRAAAGGGLEDSPFGTSRLVSSLDRANQARVRQLVERIIHLRTRDPGPVANLAVFEERVHVVAVHGTLSEQAQQK